MKFYISKIHIWFRPEEKRRTLEFENNKVNVITGSSSKGKSNILAIIDYCLLSTTPKIVYPVINEYAEWYGIEFVANGRHYSIARRKPTEEVAVADIYRQNIEFADDFYPTTANVQITDLRRELDLLFSLKEDYRTPHVDGVQDPRVSFRSFLMYNALTETIMTNPHFFTDYNFFDKKYVDNPLMRNYLLDVVLGLDKIQYGKTMARKKNLEDKKKRIEQSSKTRERHTSSFFEEIRKIRAFLESHGSTLEISDEEFSPQEWVDYLQNYYDENKPSQIDKDNKDLLELRDKLNKLIRMRDNIVEARKEMKCYVEQQDHLIDMMKPVEYLKNKMDDLGSSYWTSLVIDAFSKSLYEEIESRKSITYADTIQKVQLDNLLNDINNTKEAIRVATNKKELPATKRQEFYYAIGVLKSRLEDLKKLVNKIPLPVNEAFTEEDERELLLLTEEVRKFYPLRFSAMGELNEAFQTVYDQFNYMEYYQGCRTKYSEEDERLMLNRGVSVFNEENIGSQSNYMFLHLCYFLGLHSYMINKTNPYVAQFLFIDQPSIPYYVGAENVKTTDKEKLVDAFEAINKFMAYTIEKQGKDFQVILIEHAPENYWIDDSTGESKKSLSYFVTKEKFEDKNALIPFDIIESRKKK